MDKKWSTVRRARFEGSFRDDGRFPGQFFIFSFSQKMNWIFFRSPWRKCHLRRNVKVSLPYRTWAGKTWAHWWTYEKNWNGRFWYVLLFYNFLTLLFFCFLVSHPTSGSIWVATLGIETSRHTSLRSAGLWKDVIGESGIERNGDEFHISKRTGINQYGECTFC